MGCVAPEDRDGSNSDNEKEEKKDKPINGIKKYMFSCG